MKLHHLEICAKNGPKIVQFFTRKLDFRSVASRRRSESSAERWVVSNGSASIIVRQNEDDAQTGTVADSMFDVAFQANDVQRMTEKMQSEGVRVIVEPTIETDRHGSIVRSTVHTGFGDIVHTLVDKRYYKGGFLPGFDETDGGGLTSSSPSSTFTGFVDHVTYACMQGQMDTILDWYKRWFQMDRLIMNEMDDVREGLVIGAPIGIRLKAARTKTTASTTRPFLLVVAEPLTGHEGNHVDVFLDKHGGPGVEHVAFDTTDIVGAVTEFKSRGLQFRDAPEYGDPQSTEAGTRDDDERLRHLGILLDREGHGRHLYQAFTLPIFDEPTMFLELIRRQGAQAFGAGNITRIMKSIEMKRLSQVE